MPFRSEKQRRFLFAQRPDIAKRWARKYGSKIQPSLARALMGKKR